MDVRILDLIKLMAVQTIRFVSDTYMFLMPDNMILRIFVSLLIATVLSVIGYKKFLK